MLFSDLIAKGTNEEQKTKPLQKISNDFLLNTIEKNNPSTLKTLFYIATILKDMELEKYKDDELVDVELDKTAMQDCTMISDSTLRRNIKQMQQTSITFIDEKKKTQTGVSLIPRYEIQFGKNKIHLKLFGQIAKMIIDVEKNYTFMNVKNVMKLDSKHSIRMLGLLNNLDTYSIKATDKKALEQIRDNLDLINNPEYAKYVEQEDLVRKTEELKRKPLPKTISMTLSDINSFFGTNYKTWGEAERKIFKVSEEELERKSPLYFSYDVNYKSVGVGRPAFDYIKIFVHIQKGVQSRLANFM